jgi:predicted MFS family arabinose efflux permease
VSSGQRAQISWLSISVIIGASIMISLSMGMRQSMGLFLGPVTGAHVMTVADFTLAIAVQNIVWGLTQPFVGALADRYGVRLVTLTGGILHAVGLSFVVVMPSALSFLIGSGLIVGVALSCTTMSVSMSAAARMVTPAQRSLVLGIVSGAGSLGTFIAAPLAQSLIRSDGWQIALIAFIGLAAAMLPGALLTGGADRVSRDTVGGGSEAASFQDALGEAFSHGGYVTMALAFFVCGLQLVFITNHVPTYLALCGMDPMLGAEMLATIGLFNIFGSLLFGWLGGKFPKQILLGLVYLLRSAILAAYFMMPVSTASTLVFAAFMGTLWLGVVPLVNGLVAEIFGTRFMGMLTGVAFFSHQVGSFLGVWGGGVIYERLGSYDLAWQSAVAVGLTAGLAQLMMSVRPTARMAVPA